MLVGRLALRMNLIMIMRLKGGLLVDLVLLMRMGLGKEGGRLSQVLGNCVKCAVIGFAMLLLWSVDMEGFAMSAVWRCGKLLDSAICVGVGFLRCCKLKIGRRSWLRLLRRLGLFIMRVNNSSLL